jgi:hypothetical protein
LKAILKIFVIFLLVIISFELFLRYSPFSSGISPVLYNQDIGMWHKKKFESYAIKSCYKTKYKFDEQGRVANSYQYDSSKRDIVILGDSQVEALMVANDKIIHNSLYKELSGKCNVLNYSLSGTGPSQQFQILKTKVDLNNVDTILHFVFLENDLNDADPKNFTSTNRPKVYMRFKDLKNFEVISPRDYDLKEKIRDTLGNFELYVYLKKTIYYYSSILKDKTKDIKAIHNKQKSFELKNEEYKWRQLKGSIYQINKLAKKFNIKYNVVVYSTYEFNDNHTLKREKFEKFLNNNGIPNTNIVPFLKELSKNEELSFECDGHWNGNTHHKIAKYLAKELL